MEHRLDADGDGTDSSDLAETPEGQAWHYHNEAVIRRADNTKRDGEIGYGGRLAILLVEDDRRLCDSLAALLRVVGYDVVKVYEGLEALAAAGTRSFDAAIIDIGLPDTDGVEVLSSLREADPEMGTLVLSGAETLGDAIESLDIGADAFALKPSDPEVLLSKVGKVARLGRLQRGLGGPEAGFGDLFENIGDGVFRSDLEGNYTFMNRAGAGILGFDGPEGLLYGRLKAWEVFSSREEYEALMMRVLDEGEARQVLSRFRRRDGYLGWLETTLKTRKGTDGAVIGFEGVFRDVTDRIRYQETLEALYGLCADLTEVEAVDEIGGLTIEFLSGTLGIDRGGFAVVDGDVITWMGREGERELRELPPGGQHLVSRAVFTGEAQMIRDIQSDHDHFLENVGEGIQSVLVVPVKRDGEVVASIDMGSSKPNAFTEEDVKLVEFVGEHIASAMDRLVRVRFGIRPSTNLSDFL